MRRHLLLTLAVLMGGVPVLAATSNAGFGLDAFNRSVGATTRGNAVFSPISFEFDCVVLSEAFGALTRAKYAETMGVLNGLENVYQPIYERLSSATDHQFSFLTARGFCVPDERKAHPAYRSWMQRTFSAEAFSKDFLKGAECWFRARMDGEMEDFAFSDRFTSEGFYTYYDLVSVRFSWREPFPTNNTKTINFRLEDGSTTAIPAMCDLRLADVWVRKNHTVLRLPISDESWIFFLLPKEGLAIRDIRGEVTSTTLLDLTGGIKAITEPGITHGAASIVIPKMDIRMESDIRPALSYFGFPVVDMERMESGIRPKLMRQCVRFRLDEQGLDKDPLAEKPLEEVVASLPDTPRVILNRPFLFFVYHEPTQSIPVVGQFMGR